MKIKANEELFNKWKKLADKIGFFAPQIVQNDIELSLSQINRGFGFTDELLKEFIGLVGETRKYVYGGSKDEDKSEYTTSQENL